VQAPPLLVSFPLALGRFIEQGEAFCRGERASLVAADDADGVAIDDPVNFVTRPNPEPVRDRFWDRDLELAGNLGHILTLARILALIK
jgi:hypothetical protein